MPDLYRSLSKGKYEGTLSEISTLEIDKDASYTILDFPIGGITNSQMINALTDAQKKFYQAGSVYMCTDTVSGQYTAKHFYKLTDQNTWIDVTPEQIIKPITLTSTTLSADELLLIQTYNVVLQSDITLGSGTTLHAQTILTKPFSYSNTLRGLYIDNSKIGTYLIDTNTKVLGQGAQDVVLNGIAQLNGKAIPSYPSTSNKSYNCQYVNTGMQWVEDNTVKVPLFSTSATYNLGNLVSYNNAIYECISAVTTAGSWTGSINWSEKTLEQLLDSKQDALTFDSAPTASSINPVTSEGIKTYVDDRFDGASKAISYGNYSTMITAFNALADDVYSVGQDIYIVTTDVPDLWVSSVESTSSTYTYVDDATFISDLNTNGYVQIGYYRLSALETQKIDLTDYVTTNTAQTITRKKTIDTEIVFTNSGAAGTNSLSIKNDNGYNAKIKMGSTENLRLMTGGTYFGATAGPITSEATDLGASSAKWRDLYLSRNLTDGTNSITIADVANRSFKKIPVPSSTTLTDSEITNIILGCQVDGDFLGLLIPTLFPAREIAGVVYRGIMIGYLTSGNAYIGMYEINKGTKVITQLAQTNNLVDLRNIANLYISNYTLNTDQFGQFQIGNANATSMQFDGSTVRSQNIVPMANNQKDLGSSSMKWKDLYLSGNISDGTTSVAVNQITPKSMVGDAYDNTSTYAVNDVVIYNNTLYKCITAVTVAEDFDNTKWTSTTLIAYIQSLVSGA